MTASISVTGDMSLPFMAGFSMALLRAAGITDDAENIHSVSYEHEAGHVPSITVTYWLRKGDPTELIKSTVRFVPDVGRLGGAQP